ncbi:MAG TPA: acetyltransferase [Pyrinomonadaceae bacterium]|nr:acetyltransferase [Pyrinomonadaceae bacterium]
MKKKVVLFGVGNLTDVLFYYYQKFNLADVVAFTIDEVYKKDETHCGLPIIGFEEIETKFQPSNYELLIPLSPNKMNKLREAKFLQAKQKGYDLANFVHPSAIIESSLIGENNIVLEDVILQPFSQLDDNNVIWSKTYVGHHCKIGSNNWISANTTIGGESVVENNCFLGINASLKNNIVISNETFIGMGLSINRSSNPKEVFIGESLVAHKLTSDRLGKIV